MRVLMGSRPPTTFFECQVKSGAKPLRDFFGGGGGLLFCIFYVCMFTTMNPLWSCCMGRWSGGGKGFGVFETWENLDHNFKEKRLRNFLAKTSVCLCFLS